MQQSWNWFRTVSSNIKTKLFKSVWPFSNCWGSSFTMKSKSMRWLNSCWPMWMISAVRSTRAARKLLYFCICISYWLLILIVLVPFSSLINLEKHYAAASQGMERNIVLLSIFGTWNCKIKSYWDSHHHLTSVWICNPNSIKNRKLSQSSKSKNILLMTWFK